MSQSDDAIQRDPITRSSGANVPPPGPDREISPEEEEGVDSADSEGKSPLGVGESITRRGEDVKDSDGKEAGRRDTGTEGRADRPTGESDVRDSTSVDPG